MMPEGFYTGIVEGPWWLLAAGYVWRGKRFEGDTVVNKIAGQFFIRGKVAGTPERFTITYPGGLTDVLELTAPDTYRGTMTVGPLVASFTLIKG